MASKITPIFLIQGNTTNATTGVAVPQTKNKKRIPAKHYKLTSDEERAVLVKRILGQGYTIKEVSEREC